LFTIDKKVKKTASFRSSIVPLNLKPNALLILFYIFIMRSMSVYGREREKEREKWIFYFFVVDGNSKNNNYPHLNLEINNMILYVLHL
jgi:hypothetical protein